MLQSMQPCIEMQQWGPCTSANWASRVTDSTTVSDELPGPHAVNSCVCVLWYMLTRGEAALQGEGGVNLTLVAAGAPQAVAMPSRLGETWTLSSVGHPQSTLP